MNIKELTNETLDSAWNDVMKAKAYKDENLLLKEILLKYPKNDDLLIIAMKIAVVDVTNSTHFHLYKEKLNLLEFAQFIQNKDLNFDERVKAGDKKLVEELAHNNGKVNLFSLASKYCFYHNSIIYGRNDYAKYDTIVSKILPEYAKGKVTYKSNEITTTTLQQLRQNKNYEDFNNIVDKILSKAEITTDNKKSKFDALMWFYNRKI